MASSGETAAAGILGCCLVVIHFAGVRDLHGERCRRTDQDARRRRTRPRARRRWSGKRAWGRSRGTPRCRARSCPGSSRAPSLASSSKVETATTSAVMPPGGVPMLMPRPSMCSGLSDGRQHARGFGAAHPVRHLRRNHADVAEARGLHRSPRSTRWPSPVPASRSGGGRCDSRDTPAGCSLRYRPARHRSVCRRWRDTVPGEVRAEEKCRRP